MKYYVAAGFAVALAAGTLWFIKKNPAQVQNEWKRYAVEAETKVRPERFEAMKFNPAEVRAPASKDKK